MDDQLTIRVTTRTRVKRELSASPAHARGGADLSGRLDLAAERGLGKVAGDDNPLVGSQ